MYAQLQNLRRIARTRYPRFSFGLSPAAGEIPIFTFHDVEREAFERDVLFLLRNGYKPLSLSQFDDTSGRPEPGSVLLTFDDARSSFYEEAFPVLRKHKVHATLFVPTGWVGKEVVALDRRFSFMDWRQLREVADSGLVDVQSHGHRHALVYTASDLVTFCEPGLIERFDIFDWPAHSAHGEQHLGIPPLGTPIFKAAPVLSCRQRALDSAALNERCADLVRANGGTAFFRSDNWKQQLSRLVAESQNSEPMELVDTADWQNEEFAMPRQLFEDNLGFAPTHIAYPWMLGNENTIDLARDSGIHTVFGVAIDFRRCKSINTGRAFGRYKSDWLKLLPGEGRDSLARIIRRKLFGDGQGHLAH